MALSKVKIPLSLGLDPNHTHATQGGIMPLTRHNTHQLSH